MTSKASLAALQEEVAGLDIFFTPAASWIESQGIGFEPSAEAPWRTRGAIRTRGAVTTRGGDASAGQTAPLRGCLKGVDIIWEFKECADGAELMLVAAPTLHRSPPVEIRFTGPDGDSIARDFKIQRSLAQKLRNGRNRIEITRSDGLRLSVFVKINSFGSGTDKPGSQGSGHEDGDVLEEARKAVRAFRSYCLEKGKKYCEPDGGILSLGELEDVISKAKTIGADIPTDTTALIFGDTGTGKELIARIIHREREKWLIERTDFDKLKNAQVPFRACNCSQIDGDTNIQISRLFGRAPGYLYSRDPGELGAFLEAAGFRLPTPGERMPQQDGREGVLFMDEIADLPFDSQARLLRALEDGVVEPLGFPPFKAGAKVVFATNKAEVISNPEKFREDLYFRINQNILELQPLRCRRKIIPHLVYYFSDQYLILRERKLDYHWDDEALVALCAYSWSGNIRELKHVVKEVLLHTKWPGHIGLDALGEAIRNNYQATLPQWSPQEDQIIEEIAELTKRLFSEVWGDLPDGITGWKDTPATTEQLKKLKSRLREMVESKLGDLAKIIEKLERTRNQENTSLRQGYDTIGTGDATSIGWDLTCGKATEKPKPCLDQVTAWLKESVSKELQKTDDLRRRAKELIKEALSSLKGTVHMSNQAEKRLFGQEYAVFAMFIGLTHRAFGE